MTLTLIRQNLEREKAILNEIMGLQNQIEVIESSQHPTVDSAKTIESLEKSMEQLLVQIEIINNAVPEIINNTPFYKHLEEKTGKKKQKEIMGVNYVDSKEDKELKIVIRRKDEGSFLKSITAYTDTLKKSGNKTVEKIPFASYIGFSNRIFRNTSARLVKTVYFDSLRTDLRKITSPILATSYISVLLLSTLITLVLAFPLAGILIFLNFTKIFYSLLIALAFPILVFILIYFYPSSKRRALEKEINQELPFVTIYMSAISTSGIEPSRIFEILVSSKDYPFTQREVKKLTNYINFYGYDLVSALRTVSRNCPSEGLGQLFDGLATTITSGGGLTDYLNKHSDTLLFDYRLEREKYTHVAETFMNIYISIVIAAPMILMILFILMSLTGFAASYITPTSIGVLIVLSISLLNIGFLLFLNTKQPKF